MPADVQPICYTYITPHLFEAGGDSLADPQPRDFEKAFQLCDAIPQNQPENRQACLAGPGKEFDVLAPARDIRSIGDMGDSDLQKIISWCALAHSTEGTEDCDGSAVSSLYWGGENPAGAAIHFCSLMQDSSRQGACFKVLFGEVQTYTPDPSLQSAFCAQVPPAYTKLCAAPVRNTSDAPGITHADSPSGR